MGVAALLRLHASLRAEVRRFFASRGVLEVDTPLLGEGVVVEAHIDPIPCELAGGQRRYLLTSPEGPMKRLLARGSGPIYQLAHAFRDGEVGRRHAVEFCMLEWYRPGFDRVALMDEVEALVGELLGERLAAGAFERWDYRDLFVARAGVDPFAATASELVARMGDLGVPVPAGGEGSSIDDLLDLLMVAHVEPTLGTGGARPGGAFVFGYPPSQAALARIGSSADGRDVAERFELYVGGVELANGYHELGDPVEQRERFESARRVRAVAGRAELPVDEALLEALPTMPRCSGVALGFDRLVMLAAGVGELARVRLL